MPLKPSSESQINSHGEGWGKHMPSPPFEAMVWLAFAASAIFIAFILENYTFATRLGHGDAYLPLKLNSGRHLSN